MTTKTYVFDMQGNFVTRPAMKGDTVITENNKFIRTMKMGDSIPVIQPHLTIVKKGTQGS